ncbi:hypothetical protein HJFPF1_00253 [Paramyrothecium foliicola]|nr:hypothetical protein HJFPF1_00253 [Paramyrothecium foliicola]
MVEYTIYDGIGDLPDFGDFNCRRTVVVQQDSAQFLPWHDPFSPFVRELDVWGFARTLIAADGFILQQSWTATIGSKCSKHICGKKKTPDVVPIS